MPRTKEAAVSEIDTIEAPIAAKRPMKPETGTATVTIALKHPTGIVIEAFEPVVIRLPSGKPNAFHDEKMYKSTGKQYAINGNRAPFGAIPSYPIVAGFALTHGVPKDIWEKWLEQHHDSPLVLNGLISAYDSADDAKDFADDNKLARSGLEPMLRKGDPRADKRRTRDGRFVESIEVADEQPAAA